MLDAGVSTKEKRRKEAAVHDADARKQALLVNGEAFGLAVFFWRFWFDAGRSSQSR
jgi:hypothetical protein